MLEVGKASVEEIPDVLARRLPVVADIEDLSDLGERESRSLAAVDEVDAGKGLGAVVAVAGGVRCAGRSRPSSS